MRQSLLIYSCHGKSWTDGILFKIEHKLFEILRHLYELCPRNAEIRTQFGCLVDAQLMIRSAATSLYVGSGSSAAACSRWQHHQLTTPWVAALWASWPGASGRCRGISEGDSRRIIPQEFLHLDNENMAVWLSDFEILKLDVGKFPKYDLKDFALNYST
mgnify:CR=1 FL=1